MDGIIVESGHEVSVNGCVVHKNLGVGINIHATAGSTIIGSDTVSFGNTLGDILDNGTGTHIGSTTGSGATAQEVWEYNQRELTSAVQAGLDENALHAALDTYPNKDVYKAGNVVVDLSVVTDGISALDSKIGVQYLHVSGAT